MKIRLNELRGIIREIIKENIDLDFPDIKYNCISPEQLVNDLNDELDRLLSNVGKKDKDKVKRKPTGLIITRNQLTDLRNEKPKITEEDIKKLIESLTTPPNKIFSQNSKMEKTDIGRPQLTVNTGLPAIKGLVYDIKEKRFIYVNTCPGAGICIKYCFARLGHYLYDRTVDGLLRRLNLLLNDPEKFKKQLFNELLEFAEKNRIQSIGKTRKKRLFIRWNDAGDFFSEKYFQIAKEVTIELIKLGYNVTSYAYTKMAKYVLATANQKDFLMTFSLDATPEQLQQINKKNVKLQITVPNELTKGIFYHVEDEGSYFKTEESPKILKKRILDKYGDELNINEKKLIFQEDLPYKEKKITNPDEKYAVIVFPYGDSDVSAQRNDVRLTFLCQHR